MPVGKDISTFSRTRKIVGSWMLLRIDDHLSRGVFTNKGTAVRPIISVSMARPASLVLHPGQHLAKDVLAS
jgi:hypothetical protein